MCCMCNIVLYRVIWPIKFDANVMLLLRWDEVILVDNNAEMLILYSWISKLTGGMMYGI